MLCYLLLSTMLYSQLHSLCVNFQAVAFCIFSYSLQHETPACFFYICLECRHFTALLIINKLLIQFCYYRVLLYGTAGSLSLVNCHKSVSPFKIRTLFATSRSRSVSQAGATRRPTRWMTHTRFGKRMCQIKIERNHLRQSGSRMQWLVSRMSPA